MKELEKLAKTDYVSPYDLALIFLGLGDTDRTFASLTQAYEERASGLAFLKTDPRLDPLRSDARFLDLARRMNFPA